MTTVSAAAADTRGAPRAGSLVVHQVRKDLLRHRWLIRGWLLMLAVEVALFTSYANSYDGSSILLGFLMDILMLALVARLIFEDPPLGTSNAFWMTLPLSCRTLFTARLVLLTLVVLIPVIVAQGLCLWRLKVPAPQIPPALGAGALWQSALILAYAALASALRGYLRFVGVAVLVTTGTFILLGNLQRVIGVSVMELVAAWKSPLLLLTVVGAAGIAMLAVNYLVRRRLPTGVRLAGALGVVMFFWVSSASVLRYSDKVRERLEPLSALAVFEQPVMMTGLDESTRMNFKRNDPLHLGAAFRYPAPVDAHLLFPARLTSRLDFGYGREWTFDPGDRRMWSLDGSFPHNEVLGLSEPGQATAISRHILRLPGDLEVPNQPGQTGTLTTEVTMDGYRYDLAAKLPIRDGATTQVGDYGVLISQVRIKSHGEVLIEVWASRVPGRHRRPEAPISFAFAFQAPDGKPVRLEDRGAPGTGRLVVIWPHINQERHNLVLDVDTAVRLGILETDSPALLESRLLVSHASYLGSVEREFKVEEFNPLEW